MTCRLWLGREFGGVVPPPLSISGFSLWGSDPGLHWHSLRLGNPRGPPLPRKQPPGTRGAEVSWLGQKVRPRGCHTASVPLVCPSLPQAHSHAWYGGEVRGVLSSVHRPSQPFCRPSVAKASSQEWPDLWVPGLPELSSGTPLPGHLVCLEQGPVDPGRRLSCGFCVALSCSLALP